LPSVLASLTIFESNSGIVQKRKWWNKKQIKKLKEQVQKKYKKEQIKESWKDEQGL